MNTRLCSCIQSPDANEGALRGSKYSTKRTPITALLFEAKRKVPLPILQPLPPLPPAEKPGQNLRKDERSLRE